MSDSLGRSTESVCGPKKLQHSSLNTFRKLGSYCTHACSWFTKCLKIISSIHDMSICDFNIVEILNEEVLESLIDNCNTLVNSRPVNIFHWAVYNSGLFLFDKVWLNLKIHYARKVSDFSLSISFRVSCLNRYKLNIVSKYFQVYCLLLFIGSLLMADLADALCHCCSWCLLISFQTVEQGYLCRVQAWPEEPEGTHCPAEGGRRVHS